MQPIQRRIDLGNLVRELAENRVTALEMIREAISNSKDHGAERVWIKTTKDHRNEVTVVFGDDGEGMDQARLEAFWGIGATSKPPGRAAIGYKGHGTKLFFDCRRLSVATRTRPSDPWVVTRLDMPNEFQGTELLAAPLQPGEALAREIEGMHLDDAKGVVILIEDVRAEDKEHLLQRTRIESFCDWFTAVGDIRSGLFDTRAEFHRAIDRGDRVLDDLRRHEGALRPIEIRLRVNGEPEFFGIGQGPTNQDKEFLCPWADDDGREFGGRPGLLAFGHRFADVHESEQGPTRVRDDTSALRLTDPSTWASEEGVAIVARVEGHRWQIQTYREAKWQGHSGIYGFEERFGLWLCHDFIPIVQRNDLLKQALGKFDLRYELGNLRNWKFFVNHQGFKLTANRNDVSNKASIELKVVETLQDVLGTALKRPGFREWIARFRSASLERTEDREIDQIRRRLEEVEHWIDSGPTKDAIDISDVQGSAPVDPEDSLLLRAPSAEQDLFYVYGLLSGRFEMPIHLIEYDATEGIDAIGKLRQPALIPERRAHVRVELKLEVDANKSINHFFDAIDVIVCWKVGRTGDIYEKTSAAGIGKLRKRKSILDPQLDTHEIVYPTDAGKERTIPVLQISTLFPGVAGSRSRKRV